MADLSSTWLGLSLECPLIAGASPATDTLDDVKALADAGAGAVVMQSLFEEEIRAEELAMASHLDEGTETFGEALSYFPEPTGDFAHGPERYLRRLESFKEALSIPVVGSLNGVSPGGWVDYATRMESAGADALELNVYYLATDPNESPDAVEHRYLDSLAEVRGRVQIPLALKLSPFFSSLPNFARRAAEGGAAGLVLFNRFFQPDIDIEALEASPALTLSRPDELLLRLRWLAMIHGRVDIQLAASGGVHNVESVMKALMAGADVVQLASVLLRQGPEYIGVLRRGLERWLDDHEYTSARQAVGSMSLAKAPDPQAYVRANYAKILRSWYHEEID